MLPLPTHGVSGDALPRRPVRSVLSEAVIAAFTAQYDGTMATARRLAGQLGQPVNVVVAWAQELGIAEAAIARTVQQRDREAVQAVRADMEQEDNAPKKRCIQCGVERTYASYRRGGRAPDGYANTCLVCRPMGAARAHQVKQTEPPATVAPVARPMGAERVVKLASGATVTVWFAGNLLTMPKADRQFVMTLLDAIEQYEDEAAS